MKRKLRSLGSFFTLLVLFFAPELAKADHFAAGDLSATYIGPGIDGCTGTTQYLYEVIFDEYKPCDPGNADLPPTETAFYHSNTVGGPPVPIPFTSPQIDTLDQLCDVFKSQNRCHNPVSTAPLGFVRHRFKTTVLLPSAQTDWIFSWSSCCTTQPLLNVQGFVNIYIEIGLNNVAKYNASTPKYLIEPLPYICVNQPAAFLNGPYDPNNDSLETVAIQHWLTPTTQLPFAPGYSLTNPIQASAANPYKVNPETGAATFTPTLQGRFNLAFQTNEYDRKTGVLIAYARRDVEVNVLPCAAPPPSVDSIPADPTVSGGKIVSLQGKTSNKVVVACPGNNINFSVSSNSVNPARKIYMSADTRTVPGATFNVSGAGTAGASGTLLWTPTVNDIGDHTVTITSKDSTCDGTGSLIALANYSVVVIKVIGGLDAGKDIKTCALNPPTRQLNVKGFGNIALNVKWTDISGGPAKGLNNDTSYSPIVQAPGGNTYVVYSPDLVGQCKARDTVILYNDTSNTLDIFPQTDKYVMCRPGYLQLDVIPGGDGPVDNIPCDTLPNITTTKRDSIAIWGSPVFGEGHPFDTVGTSNAKLENEWTSSKYQFIIPQSELREYGLRSGSIKSLSFEIAKNTDPTYQYGDFSIYIKCTDKKELKKSDGFETGMILVYKAGTTITLEDGPHTFEFDRPYNWDTTKGLIIGICYANNPTLAAPCSFPNGFPGIFKYMPTSYNATLDFKDVPATLDVCNVKTSASINERNTRPVFGLAFCDVPGKPFLYKWYPGNLLSDSTLRSPLTYVGKTTTYQVSSLGKNGCEIADSMEAYVPVHNFSVWPADTSICYGQSVPLEVRNGSYYQWFEYEEGKYLTSHNSLSCDYCGNPVATPLKSTHYKIMVGDDVFCYDTIDAYIEVRPLPRVNILTPDTVVRYGQSVQLLVNGARLYNWTPVGSLNNPNISYPIATPTEPTAYVVAGISNTGCYSYDTVHVGINYRDNINIPTAFSPNGDGKNDVFRVTNMTFQRFIEFRVFNRWGQEVFNGLDVTKGWDGTWKGVPQEMGNYQYLIRVSSPDGLVETYKGDVTLVR